MKPVMILILVLLLIGIFSGYTYFLEKNAKIHTVVLTRDGFSPQELIVEKGDSVEFKTDLGAPFWPASDPHPIHDTYQNFDPKLPVKPDESFVFKFNKIGEWDYHDHLFPSYRGKVIVVKKGTVVLNDPVDRDSLTDLFDKFGAVGAHKKLIEAFSLSGPSSNSHSGLHLFGEVLYDRLGIDGISVCDDSFGFGCYHGFFIRAVSDRGLTVVSELDRKCVQDFGEFGLGCVHGIGHGIGEFFNHKMIDKQLKLCEGLTWKGDLFGCQGGVFMENNFPTEFTGEASSPSIRAFDPENPNEPCNNISPKFRKACYYEQSAWWLSVLKSDYKKVGELCSEAGDVNQTEACFLGLGANVVEASSYDKNLHLEACGKMPDKYSESLCRAGASWAFFSNPDKRSESDAACNDLGQFKEICLSKRMLVK